MSEFAACLKAVNDSVPLVDTCKEQPKCTTTTTKTTMSITTTTTTTTSTTSTPTTPQTGNILS